MKKMFIVLTSALLVGSGLYSMEKAAPAEAAVYGQSIVRYSTWDRATGLLTFKDSEAIQGEVYTRDGDNWFAGDTRGLAAAARVEDESIVKLLNEIVAAKEQTAPMEIVQTQVAQPEKTVELKLDEHGAVKVNQYFNFDGELFKVVRTKGAAVFALGRDGLSYVQAHPYRTAGHVVEGLYLVGAIVAIPATGGVSYVAGAAAPLVTDLTLRHGRQALRHVSDKAGKIKRESCSLQ